MNEWNNYCTGDQKSLGKCPLMEKEDKRPLENYVIQVGEGGGGKQKGD